MFGKRITLFKLAGFQVHVDLSWLILAFLVTWTLAVGWFPERHEGLDLQTYWWMGAAGALGLFVSIVFHEFAHSIVARRYGIPIKGITLFIFGGVAEMTREPPNPKSEFMMAIAGPIASLIAAGFFLGLDQVAQGTGIPVAVSGVFAYLGWINIVLVVFNMVPAFPLDGGRVLRSILWGTTKNLHRATKISSTIGGAFGVLLIVLGAFSFFAGNIIGGIWWFILGLFIHSASQMAFQQMLIRELLAGETVRQFMREDPVTVSAATPIRELVEDYIYKHHHKLFPVVDDGRLKGCITLNRIKELPKEEWDARTVGDLALPCDSGNTISPDTDAVQAFSKMHQTGAGRLIVADNGHLAGILTLKDLLSFLAMKVELEGEEISPVEKTMQEGSAS